MPPIDDKIVISEEGSEVPPTVTASKEGLSLVDKPWLIALTAAKFASSLSISAPAAVTLVASVTSALVSTVSSFVPSAETSRPSTLPLTTTLGTVKLPVMVSPVILTKPVAVSRAVLNSPKVIAFVSSALVSTSANSSASAKSAPVILVNSDILRSAMIYPVIASTASNEIP